MFKSFVGGVRKTNKISCVTGGGGMLIFPKTERGKKANFVALLLIFDFIFGGF